jgi:uncharacterized membrane protein (DUF4010 family)
VLTGLIGGLISSTNVAWTFSRLSRREKGLSGPLALGTVAACTVMFVRVFAALSVLQWPLAVLVLPFLAVPAVVGVGMVAFGLWRSPGSTDADSAGENPLQLGSALQMALLFQCVLYLVYWAHRSGGDTGLVASGFVLGLTDVDALTVSMARAGADSVARTALLAGVFANGLMKMGLAVALGDSNYRRMAGIGLGILALASAIGLVWRDN